MKILVIVNAHFGYDGISSVAKSYYRFLDKRKTRMDFVTINHGDQDFEEFVKSNGDRFYCLEERNRNPLAYLLGLYKIISKNKYDIVHVHGNSATMALELFAAYLGGVKYRIAHSHNTKCDHAVVNKILFPIFSKLYTNGFACSKEAGNFLFPHSDFIVIKNGIDCSSYKIDSNVRDRIRRMYNLEDSYVVGNIGRLTHQKNQEFLIELLPKLKDKNVKLLLVGDGENKKILAELASKLNVTDRVVFTGNINNVNEIVQGMDIFVFPSRFEGLGIVALEAQASNLKCLISTEVPKEVKVLDTTTFVNLEDDEKWAALINNEYASYDYVKRVEGADFAVQKITNAGYDIRENCKYLIKLYEKIIKEEL